MISYYPKSNISMSEIQGQTTMSFHGITGCMFHCYQCFNYEDVILHPPKERYTIDDVISEIKKQEVLIDTVIISGAEYLMAPLDKIIHDLTLIKHSTTRQLILYTTGAFFQKLKTIVDLNILDGIHIDMKLPYHILTEQDTWIIQKTMGVDALKRGYIDNCMQSIDYVIQHDQGYSQIRSVKYPFLDDSAFNMSQQWITELNIKYHKDTPYEVHLFYSLNNS